MVRVRGFDRARGSGLLATTGSVTGSGAAAGGGAGTLTVTPGDHQNQLTWTSYPGATSYRVTRFDPAWTASGATATIYSGSSTSYLDSPAPMASTRGTAATAVRTTKGLVLGEAYSYVVTPIIFGVDQTPYPAVIGRPDDGISLTNWTTVNGSTRRDARNTGHLALGGSFTTVAGGEYLAPGTYTRLIFINRPEVGPGTYVFNGCWLPSVYQPENTHRTNDGNYTHIPSLMASITYNDCTIGPGRGHGSNNSLYDQNGLIPEGGWTLNRCRIIHGGSQLFAHYQGPNVANDCFFHDMCAPDYVVDPHMDCIWISTGSASTYPLTVSRCHFEAAGRGTSSVLGPDTSTALTVQDNLFNSGSASGSIVYRTGAVIRRNRFKRYNAGGSGFVDMTDGNLVIRGIGGSATEMTDNRWTDDNSLAFGSA